jgi:diguanylate cyclase (GGDEF)-like protein
MDSANSSDDDFLLYGRTYHIWDAFDEPTFIKTLDEHLKGIDGYFTSRDPVVVTLLAGPYSHATIAPIQGTSWSVVTFFYASSLFSLDKRLPLMIVIPVIFIGFIIVNGSIGYRILFRPVELLIQSLSVAGGDKSATIYGLERDDEIGNLSRAIRDMMDKSYFDTLTGVYNRRYLEESMARIIRSLTRSKGVLSILMIDVDYFKPYNDAYGHIKGDECLKAVASALNDSLMRADDFVVRYGGEEFVVALPNIDENGARVVANRILTNLKMCGIQHENSVTAEYVTVSIGGMTTQVTNLQSWKYYIKRADEALYASKENGRNQYTHLSDTSGAV